MRRRILAAVLSAFVSCTITGNLFGYQEALPVTVSPTEITWFDATATTVATCTAGGTLIIWDLQSKAIIARGDLPQHINRGESIFLGGNKSPFVVLIRSSNTFRQPDGTDATQHSIVVFDCQNGKLVERISGGDSLWVRGVGCSDDGTQFFGLDVAGRTVRSIDLKTLAVNWSCPLPDPTLILQHPLYALRISPDGDFFVTFSDNKVIAQTNKGKNLWTLDAGPEKWRAAISTGVGTRGATQDDKKEITILQLQSGKVQWHGNAADFGDISAASANGKFIIFCQDSKATTLNLENGTTDPLPRLNSGDSIVATDSGKAIYMAKLIRIAAKGPNLPTVLSRKSDDATVIDIPSGQVDAVFK